MLSALGWILAVCALLIMYAAKNGRTQLLNSQSKLSALLLVIAVVGLLLLFGNYNKVQVSLWTPSIVSSEKQYVVNGKQVVMGVTPDSAKKNEEFFGIMIDAGSTGSRIHVFRFKHVAKGLPFELVNELFEEIKPGLSSYAENPAEGARSLVQLLDKAKDFMPESAWAQTPVALKATAGLRLLPAEQSDALLQEVKTLFGKYPFRVVDNAVTIMEGTDEGTFIWFTVNFFSGLIGDINGTLGVIDLGGGSTQVTFVPQHEETLKTAPSNYTSKINIFGNDSTLYTHSYLGLGLMSGRLQTLGGHESTQKGSDNPSTFKSVCFPSSYQGKWKHGGRSYNIIGQDVTGSRSDECYKKAKQVVLSYNVHPVAEVKDKLFATVSYYFDRAQEVQLVKDYEGGPVKVSQFIEAAEKVCSETTTNELNPFLCLDLCYINALLLDGFGFQKEATLKVSKRIKGNEISWALGAMFQLLNLSGHSVQPNNR